MVTYAPNIGSNQYTSLKTADSSNSAEEYIAVAAKFESNLGGIGIDLGASFQTTKDDRIDSKSAAGIVSFGGASLGASWYDNGDPSLKDLSLTTADTVSTISTIVGNITAGRFPFDTDDERALITVTKNRSGTSGFNIGAKYRLGAITPGITYSSMELDLKNLALSDSAMISGKSEAKALVAGVNYAVGGGLSVFVEYMKIDGKISVSGAIDDSTDADESLFMSGIIVSF